jgi:hypothetical protein
LFTDLVDIDNLESYDKDKAEIDRELIDKEAKKAKFRLLLPLGKVYNIVVYIYSSGSYIDYFRNLVRRIILIDNCTR